MNYLPYDIETYPNIFTFVGLHVPTGQTVKFEISEWLDQREQLFQFLLSCQQSGVTMVGYNNINFDYPIIHDFMTYYPRYGYAELAARADAIINGPRPKYGHSVAPWKVLIPQLDLMLVHHFNNGAKATSLKTLEFNMGALDIGDLPYAPGVPIPYEGRKVLMDYNEWDVQQTAAFLDHSGEELEFRRIMGERMERDVWNFSDVKIGVQLITDRLEAAQPGVCFDGKVKRQTIRDNVPLGECILPYIKLEHPEFKRVHDHIVNTTITDTKGALKGVTAKVGGVEVVFGTGGIHASVSKRIFKECEEYCIIDYDVKSYYPNLTIVNKLYPEHLGPIFYQTLAELYAERQQHAKGTVLNKAIKLALNGAWGTTNDKYSCLFDPKYAMTVTISGQLGLCMLAERLIELPGCELIQMNTDGLTIKCKRVDSTRADAVVADWEKTTGLEMERADYKQMNVRDVNNYIAVGTDSEVKRKGAYAYGKDLAWHQNHSCQVVARMAELSILTGRDPLIPLMLHERREDFLLCTKVPRSGKLLHGDRQIQNITRYLITNTGCALTKVLPPTEKKPDKWRNIGINTGYLTTIWDNVSELNTRQCLDINYNYYYREVLKLTNMVGDDEDT